MTRKTDFSTRRKMILGAGLLAAAPILAQAPAAHAAGTTAQATVKYQLKPNGAAQCGKCNYFIPGAPGANGQCKVVAGSISPNGWCILFAPKH